MILDAIRFDNFGTYGGQQEILLTPVDAERPIILFGGLNGGGKTTFLDAVQLAFYGPRARCSSRGRSAYRDYLRAAIHHGADPGEGASVTIDFRRAVDGRTHRYRVVRAWREGSRGIEETVEVFRDGEPDPLLAEHWDEYIESYIPSGLAHLFFFDAEQIKELAEGEHAAELLGTAIHTLLGLDLVDRLQTDLLTLERRKRQEVRVKGNPEDELQKATEELARLDRLMEEGTQETARLTSDAAQLQNQIARSEERFRHEGGELFERRKTLETTLARAREALAGEERALREIAAGVSPLLLLGPLLDVTQTQADREVEAGRARVLVTALEERDATVLGQLREAGTTDAAMTTLEEVLKADRENRQAALATPVYLHADDEFTGALRHLRGTVLPETTARIASHLATATKFREESVRVETTLTRVPAAESVAGLQRELEALRLRHRQKVAEAAAADAKCQVFLRQRQAAEQALQRAETEAAERRFGREDHDRLLNHAAKVRGTLEQFRETIVRKHASRVEALMLESLTQLLRKGGLVTGLKIDPRTFRVALTGGDGRALPMDRLSAGERQLLATSMLWGLARASGRPLPTIIDTPLARLDSSHRRHLIERYFPFASHQVILLSTDEEINETNLERLKPHIGRTYHLQFDEALRSTKITPGYFWNHEATY